MKKLILHIPLFLSTLIFAGQIKNWENIQTISFENENYSFEIVAEQHYYETFAK
jgi:hypothetical protein